MIGFRQKAFSNPYLIFQLSREKVSTLAFYINYPFNCQAEPNYDYLL